jgi:hypothetical protein
MHRYPALKRRICRKCMHLLQLQNRQEHIQVHLHGYLSSRSAKEGTCLQRGDELQGRGREHSEERLRCHHGAGRRDPGARLPLAPRASFVFLPCLNDSFLVVNTISLFPAKKYNFFIIRIDFRLTCQYMQVVCKYATYLADES